MKGAVLGVFVTGQDCEQRKIIDLEGAGLQADGAIGQPVVLGHVFDQQTFGGAGGGVVGDKAMVKGFEIVGIFTLDKLKAGGEAVLECVFATDGLAGFCFGAGGGIRGECG